MKGVRRKIVGLGGAAVLVVAFFPGSGMAEAPRQSFDIAIPVVPAPVAIEGRRQYVYELHLTSFSTAPLRIRQLSVIDADTGEILAQFADAALAARLGHVVAGGDAAPIAPGEGAVLYVELNRDRSIPLRRLSHRIDYAPVGPDTARAFSLSGMNIAVDVRPLPILGPPLAGGPWVAVHHPDWARGHRRVIYAVGGKARIPGRFAIDWVKADENGRTTSGEPDAVSATLGYGADVIAVADAVVAAVRDDMPEADRLSANPRHPIGDAAGNFVSLALPGGRYAIYEHLKPGSVRVKPGDRVRRGAIIAALGFTGTRLARIFISTSPTLLPHWRGKGCPS